MAKPNNFTWDMPYQEVQDQRFYHDCKSLSLYNLLQEWSDLKIWNMNKSSSWVWSEAQWILWNRFIDSFLQLRFLERLLLENVCKMPNPKVFKIKYTNTQKKKNTFIIIFHQSTDVFINKGLHKFTQHVAISILNSSLKIPLYLTNFNYSPYHNDYRSFLFSK